MKQYIIEAFADRLYEGNPAAICFPERWPTLDEMMAITRENNLAETSFAVKEDDGWHCAGSARRTRWTYADTPRWLRRMRYAGL